MRAEKMQRCLDSIRKHSCVHVLIKKGVEQDGCTVDLVS